MVARTRTLPRSSRRRTVSDVERTRSCAVPALRTCLVADLSSAPLTPSLPARGIATTIVAVPLLASTSVLTTLKGLEGAGRPAQGALAVPGAPSL